MPALVKEKLHDMVKGKLSTDERIGLNYTIESLYKAGVFSKLDIVLLDGYLAGYSAEELAVMILKTTAEVETILARVILAIEHSSGYLDDHFVNKVAPRYSPQQINRLKEYLTKHSQDFSGVMI